MTRSWFACAALALAAHALPYEDAASVEVLTDLKPLLSSNETWVVHFCMADEQGACESFAEGFVTIADEMAQFGIRVGFVDANDEKSKKLFTAMGVQRVPAIKGYFGPSSLNPYTRKPHRDASDYDMGSQMPRVSSIKRWAYKNMPHLVHQKSTAKTLSPLFGEAVQTGGEVAVFFTDRDDTSPLLKALSNEFAGRLTITEVHSSETELAEAYEVTEFPQLHVVMPPRPAVIDGEVTEGGMFKYEGSLKDRAALTAFLQEHALDEPIGASAAGGAAGAADGADDDAADGAAAAFLGPDEFATTVLAATDAWIVALVRGGDGGDDAAAALPDDYAAVAPKAEGSVHAAAVKCAEHAALCAKHDGAGWLAYEHGADAKRAPKRAASAKAALETAGASVPARGVRNIIPPGIDSFMSQAADEGKVLLLALTKKEEPSLMLKSVALAYEDAIHVGNLPNADEETLSRFGVPPGGGPMLIAMWAAEAAPAPGDARGEVQIQFQMQPYDRAALGPMSFRTISFWVDMLLTRVDQSGKGKEAVEKARAARGGTKVSSDSVPQLTSANWESACEPDSSMLCAIAMLDPSAGTFESDLALARAVASTAAASGDPFAFSWVDGTCELSFADAFDVQPPKLPTVVAYSPKKRRFAGFVGGFEEAPVRQFLTGIISGKRQTAPISDVPAPERTAEECAALADEAAAAEAAAAEESGDDGELDDLMAEIRAEEEAAKKAQEEEIAAEAAAAAAAKAEQDAAAAKKSSKKKKKKKKKGSSDL